MIIEQNGLITVQPADVPFNSGHVVIRLRRNAGDLAEEELVEVARSLKALISKMKRAYRPEAYNVALWDDRIELWPRWCGDISFNAFYGLKTSPQTPQMIFESYK